MDYDAIRERNLKEQAAVLAAINLEEVVAPLRARFEDEKARRAAAAEAKRLQRATTSTDSPARRSERLASREKVDFVPLFDQAAALRRQAVASRKSARVKGRVRRLVLDSGSESDDADSDEENRMLERLSIRRTVHVGANRCFVAAWPDDDDSVDAPNNTVTSRRVIDDDDSEDGAMNVERASNLPEDTTKSVTTSTETNKDRRNVSMGQHHRCNKLLADVADAIERCDKYLPTWTEGQLESVLGRFQPLTGKIEPELVQLLDERITAAHVYPAETASGIVMAAGGIDGGLALCQYKLNNDGEARVQRYRPFDHPVGCVSFARDMSPALYACGDKSGFRVLDLQQAVFSQVIANQSAAVRHFDFVDNTYGRELIAIDVEHVLLIDVRDRLCARGATYSLETAGRLCTVSVNQTFDSYFIVAGNDPCTVAMYDRRMLTGVTRQRAVRPIYTWTPALRDRDDALHSAFYSPVSGSRVLVGCAGGAFVYDVTRRPHEPEQLAHFKYRVNNNQDVTPRRPKFLHENDDIIVCGALDDGQGNEAAAITIAPVCGSISGPVHLTAGDRRRRLARWCSQIDAHPVAPVVAGFGADGAAHLWIAG